MISGLTLFFNESLTGVNLKKKFDTGGLIQCILIV